VLILLRLGHGFTPGPPAIVQATSELTVVPHHTAVGTVIRGGTRYGAWTRLNTMSAPGGGFDQGGRDDEASQSQSGGRPPEGLDWQAPWEPPAAQPPPPAYSPADHPAGYPAEYPPPGHWQPPGYGGPPYPPGPPQFSGPPGGYGPPSYSDTYHPAPGYPGGYGHPEDIRPPTNRLAIASLVSSFTGFLLCFVGSILAIILGVVALRQIKQTRQDGYGMAVAGIVIGIGTLLATLIVALFSVVPAH
jgi:Domain of unknown function (DUF4190)